MTRLPLRLTLLACLSAHRLWSGEVNGSWTAEFQGPHGRIMALRMKLQQADGIVTGTVRDERGEAVISAGRIDADNVRFTVVTDFHGEHVEQHYRGTVDGDVIRFEVMLDGGRSGDTSLCSFEAQRSTEEEPPGTEQENSSPHRDR